jgi:hypothetical protein
MKCKYYDCGWCYAPVDVKTNANQGECISPENCPYLKTQMTDQSYTVEKNNYTKITSTYPIDDEIVIINGEKYKRIIEEPKKPQTLHKTLLQKTEIYPKVCGEICDVVRGWLIDHTVIETEDEEMITFTIHKEQLQTPK